MLRIVALFFIRLALCVTASAAATIVIPTLAHASDGCDAVNSGVFDKTNYAPNGSGILFTQHDFSVGDTISFTVSGNSTAGTSSFVLLNSALNAELVRSNFGNNPESLEYTVTGSGDLTLSTWFGIGLSGPTEISVTASCGGTLATPTLAVASSNSTPAFGASVTFTATLADGSSPTGSIIFKDGSTTLGTGTISGTTATYSTSALSVGAHTITAEYAGDSSNAAATSNAITVTVAATEFVFDPAPGNLKEAMAGEDYSQPISATGGSGTLIYSLISGALPEGMVLNVSTGELTGPVDADAEVKDYTFTIQARDGNDATGTASYALKVVARKVTASDKTVAVERGGPIPDVNLTAGATGGPFTDALVAFVEPANAGVATIIRGKLAAAGPIEEPLGWYLQFKANPALTGMATVGYRLVSSLGTSNTGTVTYKIVADAAAVASEIDGMVHSFVQERQGLILNNIAVPGLLDRRIASVARNPITVTASPSGEGMLLGFASSTAQVEAARNAAEGIIRNEPVRFNAWIDGAVVAHKRDDNEGRWGSFAMLNTGADYLLNNRLLLGLSFHFDRMRDPIGEDAKLTGNGWLAGPYMSMALGERVFWDTSIRYGGSSNDIDTAFWDGEFDTTRWLIDTAIKGQWLIGEETILTPKLRAVYFNEKVDDYSVTNDSGDEIQIDGFDTEQFRISLGAEIARSFMLDNGFSITPKLGATAGYAAMDASGAFATVSAGVSLQTGNTLTIDGGLLFNMSDGGAQSVGARATISKRF